MSLTETILNAPRKFYGAMIRMFNEGMVKPDPNHLMGQRRLYHSPAAVSHEIFQEITNSGSLIETIQFMLSQNKYVYLTAAIVDDQLRINGYEVGYESYCRMVGSDDGLQSGITDMLVRIKPSKDLADLKRLECEILTRPRRDLRFNPYEPAFSWSVGLDRLDEGVIHKTRYRLINS